jgi:hypothetical protein
MKFARISILAAVVALAAAPVTARTATHEASATTIETFTRGLGITLVDADHSGKPSIGDIEIPRQQFLNRAGKKIGRGVGICVQVNTAGTGYECQTHYHFAGGDIMTAGPFSVLGKRFTWAIVGGTGAYSSMTGTLEGTWLDSKFDRARVLFRLQH